MRCALAAVAILLAGCAAGEQLLLEEPAPAPVAQVPKESCEGPSDAQCLFINSPVKLSKRAIRLSYNPYPFYRTRNDLEFVDAKGNVWVAPAGILTDGASIPPMFVPMIGDPLDRKFLNAATVHDSYCAESNKNTPYYHAARWQDVHRMLYDALRVSGTPAVKAKLMYAAVYLGGPRWKEVRTPPARKQAAASAEHAAPASATEPRLAASLQDGTLVEAVAASVRDMQADTPLPQLFSRQQLLAAFRRVKSYIERSNPSVAEVEVYLTRLELGMASARNLRKDRKRNFGTRIYLPGESRDTGGGDGGESGSDNGSGNDAGADNAGGDNAGALK